MILGLGLNLPRMDAAISTLNKLRSFDGLTFFKDYANNQLSVNADFSSGVGTGSFKSARSGTFPATYYNAAGMLIVTTTADAPRWTKGWYNEFGFQAKSGLLIESGGGQTTGRNNALWSEDFQNAAWTAAAVSVTGGTLDGVIFATVSTLTATGTSGTLTQAVTDAVAGKYTASIFIKRKTGSGTVNFRANTADGYTNITAFVGSAWTRVQVTSSSATNPTFDLQLVTSGDEVFIFGAQLEKHPWMTSYIPSTTAAKVRPAEQLSYAITGNMAAAQASIFIKFTPVGGSFQNDGIQRTFLETETVNRTIFKNTTGASVRTIPNNTDSGTVISNATTSPSSGTSYLSASTMQQNAPNSFSSSYMNGTLEGTYTVAPFATPTFGTNFFVGSRAVTSSGACNCIIESFTIYSEWYDDPEVNHISDALYGPGVVYHNYTFTPTTSSSVNVVTGTAGTVGIVVTNPVNNYLWMDTYACSDVGWVGGLNRTGETWRAFFKEGSDSELIPGCAQPVGDILMRTYTKSTGSMSDPPDTVWTDPDYGVLEMFAYREPSESFVRIYFSRFLRSDLSHAGVYCIKSTDLTCTAWGTPILVISDTANHIWNFVSLSDGSKALVCGNVQNRSGKVCLYRTTDLDNFAFYSTINATTSSQPEGQMVNEPGGGSRMLMVCRQNSGDFLLQCVSSDWGQTWGSLTSTGLGASTGAKVKPKLIIAAGMPDRVMTYFYDRGDNRVKIGTPTKFDDAFLGTWLPTYLLGTSAQGNGGIAVIDDTLRRYIVSTQSGSEPTNDYRYWIFRDIYYWAVNA